MALAAVSVAQHRTTAFLDLGTILADAILARRAVFTLRAILTRPAVFTLGAIFAGTFIALAIFTRAVVARAIFTGPILTGTLITGTIEVAIGALAAVVAPAAALLAVLAIVEVARAVVALTVFPGPIFALALLAGPVALPGRAFGAFGFRLLWVLLGLGGRFVGGLGLGLGAFVLEVDVEAGGELVADQEFRRRPVRLHGAQQTEIVFGVLQIILGEDTVPGRGGVARQLLVLFEDVLGGSAHLDAFRTVGVEGPIGVLLLGLAPAASATAVAPTLALHTLEISHYYNRLDSPRGRSRMSGNRVTFLSAKP